MKSIIILLIQIKLRLQSTKNMLRAKYNNFVIFLRLIMTTKENKVMNFNAITQSQNLLKKFIKIISLMQAL